MEHYLLEGLFEKFLNILQHKMDRNPEDYESIMGIGEPSMISFPSLEEFLKGNEIPFFKQGVSIGTENVLPVSMVVMENSDYESLMPSGILCAYPDSDREVIFCFYHGAKVSSYRAWRYPVEYIVCYRSKSAFENLLADLKVFCTEQTRKKGKVIVTDDDSVERPTLSWDDVILPASLKDDIRNNIEYFMGNEDMYRKLGIPYKRGFLFVGPPGNGKTMILKVIASQYTTWQMIIFDAQLISDNSDIDKAFRMAVEYAPSIICFEDLDSLFNSNITMSHFLNKLDGFGKYDRVLVLATTNHPEIIDPALLNRPSRFDRTWVIENPDTECRRMFIKKKFANTLSEDIIDELADGTDKFSMAYLEELYIASSLAAISRGKDLPGETEIWESFELLSSQVRDASHQFERKVKKIGFGAG